MLALLCDPPLDIMKSLYSIYVVHFVLLPCLQLFYTHPASTSPHPSYYNVLYHSRFHHNSNFVLLHSNLSSPCHSPHSISPFLAILLLNFTGAYFIVKYMHFVPVHLLIQISSAHYRFLTSNAPLTHFIPPHTCHSHIYIYLPFFSPSLLTSLYFQFQGLSTIYASSLLPNQMQSKALICHISHFFPSHHPLYMAKIIS